MVRDFFSLAFVRQPLYKHPLVLEIMVLAPDAH